MQSSRTLIMKLTKTALVLALVCLGSASAQEQDESDAADRYGHLEKGKSGFRETWVAPDADFSQYDKLFLWQAEFQFRDVGPARRTRSTMMNTRQREFGINDADRAKFEEIVSDAFVKEIQKAKNFKLVDKLGPRTLIMRGAVLDIISQVPPDMVGRSEIYLSSIGEATLVMELIDGQTGAVVAVVAERRALQPPGGSLSMMSMPTNNATIVGDIKRWSRSAANRLRTALDKAIAEKKK